MGLFRRRGFFADAARKRITETVQAIEAVTAAEIVVAVHPRSAGYGHAEYRLGCALAMAWLLVFLYHPDPFDYTLLPLELLLAFGVGAALVTFVGPLKRALVSQKAMAQEVDKAAKAAFVDLGIVRTRGRTGMLVFVSVLEGRVSIVRDVGVPEAPALAEVGPKLDQAVRRTNVERFTAHLATLAEPLRAALPRQADDHNELADGHEPTEAAK